MPESTPSGDESCPLCGRDPSPPLAAALIGSAICLVLAALVLYWPIRWVAGLYLELFA